MPVRIVGITGRGFMEYEGLARARATPRSGGDLR